MNYDTEKFCKLSPQDMGEMQPTLAETLGMERGTSKEPTGREHLERTEYILAKRKREAEKAQAVKKQVEAELKAVKGELKTEKLKSAAATAATNIAADSVGSLFINSKVKVSE